MFNLWFPCPDFIAWPAALLGATLCFAALWRKPAFAVILGLLLACRLAALGDFLLWNSGQAWLAAVLGALKDFVFITPFLYLVRLRGGKPAAGLYCAGLIFLNILDAVYIKETYFRVQRALIENTDPAALLVRMDFTIIALGVSLACLLGLQILFLKTPSRPLRKWDGPALTAVGLALLICGAAPQIPKTGDYLTDEINMERDSALVIIADSAVRNLALEALWPPPQVDMTEYAYTPQELDLLNSFGVLDPKQARPLAQPAYDRVIYVFIESLSYDFLYCKVEEPNSCTMPFYFSLMNSPDNIFLSNFYSSAFTTDEGIYAAFAGRPNFGGDDAAGFKAATIFSLAREQGYKSAYFMGASVYFRSKFKTYLNTMQVDEIYGKEQTMNLPPQNTGFPWGDTDERIFEKALLWLKDHKAEKTITILCSINTHPPFYSDRNPPPGIGDTPLTRAFYATDQALETFVRGLETEGMLDERTLLIVAADHQITHGGEMVTAHLPEKRFGNRHIPLVFVSRDLAPLRGIDRHALGSAVDMAPTLGDLLALPEQSTYYGKSLFIQDKRYELGMTRGGLFFFGTPQEKFSFDLRYYPEAAPEQALYKWYFAQGGRGGL